MGLTSFTYQIKLKIKIIIIFSLKKWRIVNNTEPKRSFSIVVSDNKTWFKTWFKPPVQLDKKKDYEIALINLEIYYSFPYIDRSNNCFSYSPGANAPWFDIIISEGSYHFEDINEFIHRQMRKNGHYHKVNDKDNIWISANINTFKSEMIINNNCEVDFRRYNSNNSLLGFDGKLYTSGFNESENMVNILTINSILVNIDIISGSYVNGLKQPTIYSFFPMSLPGIKLSKILIIFFIFQ